MMGWMAPLRHRRKTRASSYPFRADAGSRPGNCSGMEEATGAPSSFADSGPKRLRASGRDGETVMTEPPSPLRMLLSRHTKRRDFITLLGGAAAAWPLAARAQQPGGVRRIGVLMHLPADDLEGQARFRAFLQGLQQLGWTDGRNVRIETRWGASDAERMRRDAAELVVLAPDVILASTTPAMSALQQATRTIPIVFSNIADPVGAGFVETLARPGGNATGSQLLEYGLQLKLLGVLQEGAA